MFEAPISSDYSQRLTNLKFNFSHWELWFRVIYTNIRLCYFIRVKYIFIKFYSKSTSTFIATAACCKRDCLNLLLALNKLHRWLMNDQHLFILHFLFCMCDNRGFNRIFHHCFWWITVSRIMVHNWRWNSRWKLKLKRNCVVTWLKILLELKAIAFEPKNISI